jgi:hypothetical protein
MYIIILIFKALFYYYSVILFVLIYICTLYEYTLYHFYILQISNIETFFFQKHLQDFEV